MPEEGTRTAALRRLYTTVLSTIKGFGNLFWVDVVAQIDAMNEQVQGFQAQSKKLPKVRARRLLLLSIYRTPAVIRTKLRHRLTFRRGPSSCPRCGRFVSNLYRTPAVKDSSAATLPSVSRDQHSVQFCKKRAPEPAGGVLDDACARACAGPAGVAGVQGVPEGHRGVPGAAAAVPDAGAPGSAAAPLAGHRAPHRCAHARPCSEGWEPREGCMAASTTDHVPVL